MQVEPPASETAQLVGFRLRHFDADAWHALINELDDDARSWTRRQIDETHAGGPIDSAEFPSESSLNYQQSSYQYPQNDRAGDRDEDLSVNELMNLGRKALEGYDYDACERYYLRVLEASHGGLEPALCILELFVDHLAAHEKALAVSESFSKSAAKDKGVKILLALSAARCGRWSAAC